MTREALSREMEFQSEWSGTAPQDGVPTSERFLVTCRHRSFATG